MPRRSEANLEPSITRGAQAVVHKRNQRLGSPMDKNYLILKLPRHSVFHHPSVAARPRAGINLDAEFGGSKPRNRRDTTRQSSTESRKSGVKDAGTFALALSRVTEIGEQAVAAVAASLARGGPVIKGQLIASRFYEAMQRELKQLPMHDSKRAVLIAASDRCERIAAAKINPTTLLDELRKALAVLTDEHPSEPPPIKGRPVLRLIEGGLSN